MENHTTPPTPQSFAELLRQLSGGKQKRPQLATDLGFRYWQLAYWEKNNSVPEKAWTAIMDMAKAQGRTDITIELLHNLAEKSRREKANGR